MIKRHFAILLFFMAVLPTVALPQDVISGHKTAQDLLEKARLEFNMNNHIVAREIAGDALMLLFGTEEYSMLGEVYHLLGQTYEKEDDHETALVYYIRSSGSFVRVNDPGQVKVYTQAAGLFISLEMFEKAGDYYKNALDFLDENKEDPDPALVEDYAWALCNAGQLEGCNRNYTRLLGIAEEKNLTDIRLRTLYNLAEVTLRQKDYQANLKYNQLLHEHFKRAGDRQAMAFIANNMGYTLLKMEDQRGALQAFRDALSYGEESQMDNRRKAQLLSNIGICYQNLNEYENSIRFLRQGVNILRADNQTEEQARLENITANVFLLKRDVYNAGVFSLSSIESAKQSGNKWILVDCYHTYSQILKRGNDHIRALEYYELYLNLKDSLAFEQRLRDQKLAQRILDLEKSEKELRLVLADEELKDLELRNLQIETEKKEQELELLRRERALEVSERQRIMQSLELTRERHEAEIRQREIEALNQQREIQELLIKQKEAEEKEREREIRLLENEKELQQLEIERQTEARKRIIWMLFLMIAIVLLMVVSFFVVRKKNKVLAQQKQEIEEKNYDLEQKNEEIRAQSENLQTAYEEIQTTNEMLEQKSEEILTQNEQIIKQKELIEDKNKNITDSILYAGRIQNAVLPPENFLEGIVKESFLLFRPKDIVSGDFYWSASKGNYHVIAAADCTGHGVPGAFMSMLGITLLNEIIIRTEKLKASDILDQLREEVINSLKQGGAAGETKDGMDIALCVLDKKKSVLQYAAANNSMYMFRKGEMKVFNPDKMPIGISPQYDEKMENFTYNDISLQTGDIFYLFTDGYADQFGGPEGKKFKYTRFREILKEIHTKPMSEQKIILDETFEKWRGETVQIDDILIIGFKA